MNRLRIAGIHDHHDASVCLLEDGKVVFGIEEERLNRIKNYCGFPYLSLDLALKTNGLGMDDIDFFAFGLEHCPAIYDKAGLMAWYRSSDTLEAALTEAFRQSLVFGLYKAYSMHQRLKRIEKAGIPRKKVRFLNHHLAHAAAAYYGSSYDKSKDRVLVLTLDGGGDGLCGGVFVGENGVLRNICSTKEGNSIGNIYSHTTFMLGMTPLEHEYKLMGLAPYAKPEYFKAPYEKLSGLIAVDGLSFKRNWGPSTLYAYRVLKNLLQFERFDNIAGALQLATEELVLRWVRNCIAKTGIGKIACGGGVFMNVKVNKRIIEMPECESLFVFPSCGDESNAIGAAYELYAETQLEAGDMPNIAPIGAIYLGPEYSETAIEDALQRCKHSHSIRFEKAADIEATIVELLKKNAIVARFRGRLEWGARALGNRSILANASDPSNVRKINDMIKMRDFWMPFAPSILSERESDYLINPKRIPAPYMILSFDTTARRQEILAAIHAADFTARPQVVFKEHNPTYWSILNRFASLAGIGGILNTSFNLHGEPMVGSPEDALSTFLRSGLTHLALGEYLVEKSG